jgi:hypothetical protein
MFPVYVGSACSVKRLATGWKTFSWWRRGWNGGAAVAEIAAKRLLCCGFRSAGKGMEQMYQCWWGICREIIFFRVRMSHVLRFICPFVIYLLTPPRIWDWGLFSLKQQVCYKFRIFLQLSLLKLIACAECNRTCILDYVPVFILKWLYQVSLSYFRLFCVCSAQSHFCWIPFQLSNKWCFTINLILSSWLSLVMLRIHVTR